MHFKENTAVTSPGDMEVKKMEPGPVIVSGTTSSQTVADYTFSSTLNNNTSATNCGSSVTEQNGETENIAFQKVDATNVTDPSCEMQSCRLNISGSDSAVDTDDAAVQENIIIGSEVKMELDSDLEELDSNSNSSLSNSFNWESDASMRKRLFTSLSQSCPGSALFRALHSVNAMGGESDDEDPCAYDRLSSSCFAELLSEKMDDDDELTSLAWLQDSNLLKNISEIGLDHIKEEQKENSDEQANGAVGGAPQQVHQVPYHPFKHVTSKPPFSFSCLIFMAIESSPSKRLPVKDIYNWVTSHFPYYKTAVSGWKNSVRHNLSLNKCFRKVEKDKSTNVGKGSLWCIDPVYRPTLLQALRKTSYHPYQQHQLQMLSTVQPQQQIQNFPGLSSGMQALPFYRQPVPQNALSPDLFPYLSQKLAKPGLENIDTQKNSEFRTNMIFNSEIQAEEIPAKITIKSEQQQECEQNELITNEKIKKEKLGCKGPCWDSLDKEMQDVVYSLMKLRSKQSSGRSSDASDSGSASSQGLKRKRNGAPRPQEPIVLHNPPSDDHIYASPVILEEDLPSGASSIDNEYEFGDKDDDISEPSDYPADWDLSDGDEVDGDAPTGHQKNCDMSVVAAKLLMNFARRNDYKDEHNSTDLGCTSNGVPSSSSKFGAKESSSSPSPKKKALVPSKRKALVPSKKTKLDSSKKAQVSKKKKALVPSKKKALDPSKKKALVSSKKKKMVSSKKKELASSDKKALVPSEKKVLVSSKRKGSIARKAGTFSEDAVKLSSRSARKQSVHKTVAAAKSKAKSSRLVADARASEQPTRGVAASAVPNLPTAASRFVTTKSNIQSLDVLPSAKPASTETCTRSSIPRTSVMVTRRVAAAAEAEVKAEAETAHKALGSKSNAAAICEDLEKAAALIRKRGASPSSMCTRGKKFIKRYIYE